MSRSAELVLCRSSARSRRPGSGGAPADQPDGRGDEQYRQREQPAALDPLEWPEPAAWLVAGPQRVPVLDEVLVHGGVVLRDPALPPGQLRRPLEDLAEHGLADRLAALGVPLLADDPGEAGRVRVLDQQRRHVVLAQVKPGC